jgi:hypothetical protein
MSMPTCLLPAMNGYHNAMRQCVEQRKRLQSRSHIMSWLPSGGYVFHDHYRESGSRLRTSVAKKLTPWMRASSLKS